MKALTPVSYRKIKNKKEVKEIYSSSFPREERLAWGFLRFLCVQRGVEVVGYYENGELCGFTYTVTTDDVLFVLFFAVKEDKRGEGYGSAILSLLKENNPDKAVLLNIEPLDESADNYGERVRRFAFYEKNGFSDTGYEIDEIGGTFRVLSTERSLDVEAYLRVFRSMSFPCGDRELRE